MAKRRLNRRTSQQKQVSLMKRRALLLVLLWTFIIVIAGLFGYSYGYPLIAAGQIGWGILIGAVYGGGALLAILAAFFVNRKLRGL